MKILLFCALFFISLAASAACDKVIDNSKVMLFVDTNQSDKEIATAEEAACTRGQRLVVVPNNYKDYTKPLALVAQHEKALKKCRKSTPDECDDEYLDLSNAYSQVSKVSVYQSDIKSQIRSELKKIKNEKATLENFILSGHDGGGRYGGKKSTILRQEVFDIMKNYKEINNVQTVMLLGCYTGVPKEVSDWRLAFPDLRLIAGFDGIAPLSDKEGGHEFIYDILTHEKEVITAADDKKLQEAITSNINSIKILNASMYIRPSCQSLEDEKDFYYGRTITKPKVLREFDLKKECETAKPQLIALKERLDKFYSGELEPPVDTKNGELRDIYSTGRMYEHCLESGQLILDVDRAFGILFFDKIKKNFGHFYNRNFEQAEEIIQSSLKEELERGQSKPKNGNSSLFDAVKDKLSIKVDPEKLKKVWMPTEKNLAGKSRKEILDNIYNMDELRATPNLPKKLRQTLSWASRTTSKHMTYLEAPWSWHDFAGESEPPADYVTLREELAL